MTGLPLMESIVNEPIISKIRLLPSIGKKKKKDKKKEVNLTYPYVLSFFFIIVLKNVKPSVIYI